MKLLKLGFVSAAYAACPQERPFSQTEIVGSKEVKFCCPSITLIKPVDGQTVPKACSVCDPTGSSNCDNYQSPAANNPAVVGPNTGTNTGVAGAAAAGTAGATATGNLPTNAVQCPVTYPFSKYKPNTGTVESCCKCKSQTQCQAAGTGVNYYNVGGVEAMNANDDVVDKTGLMCGKGCSDTEECRYDKENCEYKCCVKWAVVWGVVGALLGLLALALLALLIWCCCCRKKKKVAPPPVVKPRTPTPPPPVKEPSPIPSSSSSSSSEEVIIQKEIPVAKPKTPTPVPTPTPTPPPIPSSSSSSTSSSETSVEVIRTPTPPPPKPRTPTPPPPREPTPPPPPSSSSSSSAAPSPIIKKWTPLENPTVVYASYVRSTNSEDDRTPARRPSFNADWVANSRRVDSDYEGKNNIMSSKREVDMDDYKMHNVSGVQDESTLWRNRKRSNSSSSSSSSDADGNKARSINPSSYTTNPLNSTGIRSTNNGRSTNDGRGRSGSPVAARRQSPPRVRRAYN